MDQIVKVIKNANEISNDFSNFEGYLIKLGLPTEGIVANSSERAIVLDNIANIVEKMPAGLRKDAKYLSKFIAGSAIGLFDSSLNFVWDEVVIKLRNKVILYDIATFFDLAVGEKQREFFNTEDDLSGIKDNVLLNTCRKLEIISDLVYKKLSHILTMRNDIGTSHPNVYSINSFELLGWLQSCVTDVLSDTSSKAAITMKALVDNLIKETSLLDSKTVASVEESVKSLSSSVSGNLLIRLFGIFTDEATNKMVRQNILQLAPCIWSNSLDDVKYELGIKLDKFKVNLYKDRLTYGERFFEVCDGNRYKSSDSKSLILSYISDDLINSHYEYNNYHYEGPFAKEIMSYITNCNDIPVEEEEKLIKRFLICRVGNGRSYCDGVSPYGKPYYDAFFKIIDENQIIKLLKLIDSNELSSILYNNLCKTNLICILNIVNSNLLSDRIKEIIEFLIKNKKVLDKITKDKNYQDLAKEIFV